MTARGLWTDAEEAGSPEEATLISERAPQETQLEMKTLASRRSLLVAVAMVALLCLAAGVGYNNSRGAPGAPVADRLDLVSAAQTKSSKSDGKSSKKPTKEPTKEIYALATLDFDGAKQKNSLPLHIGDFLLVLGDENDSGWAFVQKLPKDGSSKGKDAKVETGYVPTWAIKEIPKGSGKDTAKAMAEKKGTSK